MLNYDQEGMEKDLTEDAEQRLVKSGFEVQRAGDNSLWVPGLTGQDQDPFALKLSTYHSSPWGYYEDEAKWEPAGTKTIGRVFRREGPIHMEIPVVEVSGTVTFERLEGSDPAPVLDVLTSLGYGCEVIPTSQELEEAVVRAKSSSSSSSGYRSSSGSSDSGPGLGTGLVIGAVLGGVLGD